MDFLQESSPPNFIPFYLDKHHSQNDQTPDLGSTTSPAPGKVCTPTPFPPIKASSSRTQVRATDSPFRTDSNVDVTTYASEIVQRMEGAQSSEESGTWVLLKMSPRRIVTRVTHPQIRVLTK